VLVAFNSILQIVLFSPFAILYINTISPGSQDEIHIDYTTVARSVAAFLGQSPSYHSALRVEMLTRPASLITHTRHPARTRPPYSKLLHRDQGAKVLPSQVPASDCASLAPRSHLHDDHHLCRSRQAGESAATPLSPRPCTLCSPSSFLFAKKLISAKRLQTGGLLHHRRPPRHRPPPRLLHHHVLPRPMDLHPSRRELRAERHAGLHWR
jgi:hypothetical protein